MGGGNPGGKESKENFPVGDEQLLQDVELEKKRTDRDFKGPGRQSSGRGHEGKVLKPTEKWLSKAAGTRIKSVHSK